MNAATVPSKGTLLGRLQGLIRDAQKELKAFAEGRLVYFGYLEALRSRIQQCLADIDQARDELREIASIDLNPSEGLQKYYDKKIFNDFEAPGDAEFARLQQEYGRETPPKLQRMIELLSQVRSKMLGIAPAPIRGEPRKPYSRRDHALYEMTKQDLPRMTDAELWDRYGEKWKKLEPDGTWNAFRSSLFRIRRRHSVPAPKRKKNPLS